MASRIPGMVCDFGGFPQYLSCIKSAAQLPGPRSWPAESMPLIEGAGLNTHLNPARGFDRGTYSLLAYPLPRGRCPVIQVSIRSDYDPESHLKLAHFARSVFSPSGVA